MSWAHAVQTNPCPNSQSPSSPSRSPRRQKAHPRRIRHAGGVVANSKNPCPVTSVLYRAARRFIDHFGKAESITSRLLFVFGGPSLAPTLLRLARRAITPSFSPPTSRVLETLGPRARERRGGS